MRLIQIAGRQPEGLQERLPVEGPPLPIARALRQVGDDHVRMQMRLGRPARAVLVGGSQEALAALPAVAVLPPACHARLRLQESERRPPSRAVRLRNLTTRLLVAERVQEADALRRREDQIEPGDGGELLLLPPAPARGGVDPLDRDRARLHRSPQLLPRPRIPAPDQRAKLALAHLTLEAQAGGAAPRPLAGRLTRAGVIVVQAGGHRALVIRLLPRRQLRNRQHP
jgi:hypothetical protein